MLFENVIIWENHDNATGTDQDDSVYYVNPLNDLFTADHSIIQGSGDSGASWDTAFGNDGGNNVDADPMFVDPIDNPGASRKSPATSIS